MERLISKAKQSNLANRRNIISSLQTIESAHKLVDDIVIKKQSSNYLKQIYKVKNLKSFFFKSLKSSGTSFHRCLYLRADKKPKPIIPKRKKIGFQALNNHPADSIETTRIIIFCFFIYLIFSHNYKVS